MTTLIDLPKDILRMIAKLTFSHSHRPFALVCRALADAVTWHRPLSTCKLAIMQRRYKHMRTWMRPCDVPELLNWATLHTRLDVWQELAALTNAPCTVTNEFIKLCSDTARMDVLTIAFARASNPEQIATYINLHHGELHKTIYPAAMCAHIPINITHYNFKYVWPLYAHAIPPDRCWQLASQAQYRDFTNDLEVWLAETGYVPCVAYQPTMLTWMLARGYEPTHADGFDMYLYVGYNADLFGKYQDWLHRRLNDAPKPPDCMCLMKAIHALTPAEKHRLLTSSAANTYLKSAPSLFQLTDEELNEERARFEPTCMELTQRYHPHDFSWLGQFETHDEAYRGLMKDLNNELSARMQRYYALADAPNKKYRKFVQTRQHLFIDTWLEAAREQCEPLRCLRLQRQTIDIDDGWSDVEVDSCDDASDDASANEDDLSG